VDYDRDFESMFPTVLKTKGALLPSVATLLNLEQLSGSSMMVGALIWKMAMMTQER
jgi:hypothetical protein